MLVLVPSIGVHECTFRVNHVAQWLALGVISTQDINYDGFGFKVAYEYSTDGYYRRCNREEVRLKSYDAGDEVTVRLDVDAGTVAFRKNGDHPLLGSPRQMPPGQAYHFSFDTYKAGECVTIVEMW